MRSLALFSRSLRSGLVQTASVVVTACLLLALLAPDAWGIPMISRSFVYIDNRSPADPFGNAGLSLHAEIIATDTGGPSALMGVGAGAAASSNNPAFPFTQPFPLFLNPLVRVPEPGGVDFIRFLFIDATAFSNITGTYTLGVRNTSLQTATTTQTLLRPEVIAFPTGLLVSNNSTMPLVSFTDPSPTPALPGLGRRYQVQLIDESLTIFFSSPLLADPEFQVPAGVLTPGQDYLFRANIFDFDITQGVPGVSNPIAAAAREYGALEPVPEPSTLVLLGSSLVALGGAYWKGRRNQA